MFIERNTREWNNANKFYKQQRNDRIERDIMGEFEILEDLIYVNKQESEDE